ncbi:hypothetical protein [Congregibacter sp.]|uniref:hypothetical protein n=1 Tax=Congregibacter sp. TaxID=2744308 RepID=UPI00385B4971
MVDQSVLWIEILTVTDCYTDELFGMPRKLRLNPVVYSLGATKLTGRDGFIYNLRKLAI